MNAPAMKRTMEIIKALADVQRVRIMMFLQAGELCVCQIVELLRLAPSTVSKHLSILSSAGLVDSRKDGRWAYYRLPQGSVSESVRPLLKWIRGSLRDDAAIKEDAKNLKRILTCDPESLCRRQRSRG